MLREKYVGASVVLVTVCFYSWEVDTQIISYFYFTFLYRNYSKINLKNKNRDDGCIVGQKKKKETK